MHEQLLERVAHARALHLGVHDDLHRHAEVRARVHVEVADALVVLDHRHPGALGHPADERLAPPGDDEVDAAFPGDQEVDRLVLGPVDELHRVGRHARSGEAFPDRARDGPVGLDRLAAAFGTVTRILDPAEGHFGQGEAEVVDGHHAGLDLRRGNIVKVLCVGLLTGLGSISGSYDATEFRHRVRFVDIYLRRDGRWRYYFSQSTEIVPDNSPAAEG